MKRLLSRQAKAIRWEKIKKGSVTEPFLLVVK